MTREETKRILMTIQSIYQNFRPMDMKVTLDTWTTLLSEYTYQQVEAGLMAYAKSEESGFAPSPGQIIGKIHDAFGESVLSETEAWLLVSRAIRNSGYHATEEFEKLPPLVQKAVGAPGQLQNWAVTDTEAVESVIQSNFMRTYRAEVARDREYQKMPQNIKAIISKANESRPQLYVRAEHTTAERLPEKEEHSATGERIDEFMEKIRAELYDS